ncbi:MAG: RHS repeat-associated core domain-containing protein [Planctomycetes bacterium]|nr:RHS repeat-associated core domain-containing protein [Planctomycetota bacterium]
MLGIETCVGQFYHRNQMTSAVDSATDGGAATQQVTYVYDALGNRIESDTWDGTTAIVQRYGMDGWNPAKPSAVGNENFDTWVQLDGSNALVRRRVTGVDANEQIARQTAGGVVNWYLLDRQNSVMEVIDSGATVVASTTYDAYGNVTTGALSDRFGYQGMEFDSFTSDYFDRSRVYDPATGRFLSEDVKGFAAGDANLFRYVENGPTNGRDPSGMDGRITKNAKGQYSFVTPGGMIYTCNDEKELRAVIAKFINGDDGATHPDLVKLGKELLDELNKQQVPQLQYTPPAGVAGIQGTRTDKELKESFDGSLEQMGFYMSLWQQAQAANDRAKMAGTVACGVATVSVSVIAVWPVAGPAVGQLGRAVVSRFMTREVAKTAEKFTEPFGGRERAMRLIQEARDKVNVARKFGWGDTALRMAKRLEELEAEVYKAYPGLEGFLR